MKRIVSFFEIPAVDFDRAVKFYESLFNISLEKSGCDNEKMAFFPEEEGLYPGSISWSSDFEFKPSDQGVLISLSCENIEKAEERIKLNGGEILIPKTAIECDRGYFSVFKDCEGNRVGLHSEK